MFKRYFGDENRIRNLKNYYFYLPGNGMDLFGRYLCVWSNEFIPTDVID